MFWNVRLDGELVMLILKNYEKKIINNANLEELLKTINCVVSNVATKSVS